VISNTHWLKIRILFGELKMKKRSESGISVTIRKPTQFYKIFFKLPFLLIFVFVVQATPVFADGTGKGVRGFKGHESHEGYYLGGSDFQGGAEEKKGNEATGVTAAILLVVANVTVLISLILKGVNRLFSLRAETKNSISGFNNAQKKWLRKLHYILNPIAISIAMVHFFLSTCRSILPDLGLLLFIVVGVLGIISKFHLSPLGMHKAVYGVHCSSIIFIGLIILMAIGHA
jgi:hypothetical protein